MRRNMEAAAQHLHTPYPGKRPFTSSEHDIFFGRETCIAHLVERLSYARSLLVTGPSGCGKTSCIQAGLLPALEQGKFADGQYDWRIAVMHPGTSPFRNLAESLLAESALGKEAQAGVNDVAEFLRSSPHSLLQAIQEASLSQNTLFLLVIDQLEDMLEADTAEQQQERQAFLELLFTSMTQQDVPIYVVMAARAEHFGFDTFSSIPGLAEVINPGLFVMPAMTREDLEAAITEPARLVGGAIQPDVVTQVCEESLTIDHLLPALQCCLNQMWEHARSKAEEGGTVRVTQEEYEAVGGIEKPVVEPPQEERQLEETAPEQREFPAPEDMQVLPGTDSTFVPQPQPPGYRKGFVLAGFAVLAALVLVFGFLAVRQTRRTHEVLQQAAAQQRTAQQRQQKLEQEVERLDMEQEQPVQEDADSPPSIQYVDIRDAEGALIPPVEGEYYVKTGEDVTIELGIQASPSHILVVQYSTGQGLIMNLPNSINARYAAPKTPGEDTVTIRVSKGISDEQPAGDRTVKIDEAIVKTIAFKIF